ncbi:PIG-L family deacetylase [Streptomyces sp. NPDC051917]|uniref:PIG-L family deacetylase n=1 Tax=Streptomyces sp. NPDC051917 TaxID=3154754 RepID=UPI00344B718E
MTHPDAPGPPPRSTLVVTAHAGDFVWRAGGAIALAAARGEKVTIACLTSGERGESAKAWREGKSLEEIKAIRRDEAEQAAATLGAQVRFFDAGDYPLVATAELTDQLVAVYRETQPDVVLTHPVQDPYNGDHPAANRMALEARVLAQAIGYPGPGEIIGAPPVFYVAGARAGADVERGVAGGDAAGDQQDMTVRRRLCREPVLRAVRDEAVRDGVRGETVGHRPWHGAVRRSPGREAAHPVHSAGAVLGEVGVVLGGGPGNRARCGGARRGGTGRRGQECEHRHRGQDSAFESPSDHGSLRLSFS